MNLHRITVDCRGLFCPQPLLLTRSAQRANPGCEIEIWATDPLAELDIRALAARTGWEVCSCEHAADLCTLRLRPPESQAQAPGTGEVMAI